MAATQTTKTMIPDEIKKQIDDESFRYAKLLYSHAKDEDIKDSSQCDAHKEGAEFGYSLAQSEIERLKGLIEKLFSGGMKLSIGMWEDTDPKKEWEDFKNQNNL